MTAHVQKRAGSRIARVRQFFKANPGEELTYEDMGVKFGLAGGQLYEVLRTLKDEGLVEVAHVVRGANGCATPAPHRGGVSA